MSALPMEFAEYLRQKKVDPDLFRAGDPERYAEWERLFAQVNPESFTAQKKFLLNNTRRLYLLR